MKKFLPVLAVLVGLILSGCVRENDMAEPVIFVHCYDYGTSDYAIWSFDAEGVFVNKWTTPEWNQENNLCVDSSHNVYMITDAWNVIKKWDKNGTLLKSKTTDWTHGIAIGPDGYLYTRQVGLEEFGEDYVIVKRDPDTLEDISHIVMTHFGREFTLDLGGYFYVRHHPNIEKWNYDTETMIASHAISPANNWVSFAQANGIIGFCADGADVYTIPISLDENQTAWGLTDPQHIATVDTMHFVVSEYDSSDKYYKMRKYTSAGSLVWEANIEHSDNVTVYGIAAYPFYVVDKEAPWKEDIIEPTGEVKVETPSVEGQPARRSGNWVTLPDVMRIHTSNGKDTSSPRAPIELGQAEVLCCNISKNFNSFEEASDWYKNLEGYALQISLGCNIGGSPISKRLFTGIIKAVHPHRLSQTAEIRVVDFLDYFGRITIEETPVWEGISLTQLFKNLVELAFPEWVEGTDYFVEDLEGSTIPAIGYTDLNLLSELKMIAESRGKRIYTDAYGRPHCATRNPERDPLTVSYNYNLEDVRERRDIDSILNWIVVHARPHEILPDTTPPGKITGFTATPGDQKIDLTWNNPTDDDFLKTMIRFSTTHYPLNREDGTKIYEGTGESKSHTGLTNGTKYYYSGFTVDDVGNWSDAAHTSAVAGLGGEEWEDDTPPPPVSYFNAEGEHSKVILTWLNPKIADFDHVIIRRDTTSYPPTATSGTSIYSGTAETTVDTNVTNGTKYYYSAFVENTAGLQSSPAFASAVPGAEATLTGREKIETISITGSRDCGMNLEGVCEKGIYFSRYTYTQKLTFHLTRRYSEDWLRFKHTWNIWTHAGPRYSSNEQHVYGEKDDLGISSTHNSDGIAEVRLTTYSINAREVRVEYKLTYTGGKILGIAFRNSLTLMG